MPRPLSHEELLLRFTYHRPEGQKVEAHNDVRRRFPAFYDDSGAIGRRYRRQDEAGTPWCFTVDTDTLADQTVTVRERDSMQQQRVALAQVPAWIGERLAPEG